MFQVAIRSIKNIERVTKGKGDNERWRRESKYLIVYLIGGRTREEFES